jgi:hypothetical protein
MTDDISVHRSQTWESKTLGEVRKHANAFFIDMESFFLAPTGSKGQGEATD